MVSLKIIKMDFSNHLSDAFKHVRRGVPAATIRGTGCAFWRHIATAEWNPVNGLELQTRDQY